MNRGSRLQFFDDSSQFDALRKSDEYFSHLGRSKHAYPRLWAKEHLVLAVIPAKEKAAESTASSLATTGSIMWLNEGDYVARSEASFARLTQLANADDNEGILELILMDQVWLMRSRTKVRVIDPGFLTSEVRMLTGPLKPRSGFVATDLLEGK